MIDHSFVLVGNMAHHMGMIVGVNMDGGVFFRFPVPEAVDGIGTVKQKIDIVGNNDIGGIDGLQHSGQPGTGRLVESV